MTGLPSLAPLAISSCLTLSLLLASSTSAQEALPEGMSSPNTEPSSADVLMERTDLGNVAQAAQMQYGSGARELKRALKLREKVASSTDSKENAKIEEKIAKALASADQAFREALSYNANLIEAYAGLGTVLRLQGKSEDALQIHAMALRREPEDTDNFVGWSEALLSLNMLGNATSAYSDYVQTNPARAEILMSAIESWLDEKNSDPGELDPADIQRLADWVTQQKQG